MAKKKIAGQPALDPTLPDANVEIGGTTYHLVYTFAALARAQAKFKDLGMRVNVFKSVMFSDVDPIDLQVLFYAGLIDGHTDISFEEASSLITMKNFGKVFEACLAAYKQSMADPGEAKDADPKKPE